MAKDGEKSTDCWTSLRDPDIDAGRLGTAVASFNALRSYRSLLANVEGMSDEQRTACAGIAETITDRAYNAEAAMRVLIASGLETTNELRDTGQLYSAMQAFAKDGSSLDHKQLAARLDEVKQSLDGKRAEQLTDIFDEAEKLIRKTKLSCEFSDQRIVLSRAGVEGKRDEFGIALSRQPGQIGRVSVDDFFSPDTTRVHVAPGRLFVPRDCHHRPFDMEVSKLPPLDPYAGIVSGLAASKGAFYQHARRTAELGHRGMRGADPVTAAILIGIAVVGLALIIVGAVEGDPELIGFGAILVLGSVLVWCCGYALIIGVAAT